MKILIIEEKDKGMRGLIPVIRRIQSMELDTKIYLLTYSKYTWEKVFDLKLDGLICHPCSVAEFVEKMGIELKE
jgi:hypothetical protein